MLAAALIVAVCVSLIAPAAVDAAVPICSGACATSYFNTATSNICDRVQLNITGYVGGSVVGTSVVRWDSHIGGAAYVSGLLGNGENALLYLYWAGLRTMFYGSSMNPSSYCCAMSSSYSTTADYGVLISNRSTCPVMTSTATPLTVLYGLPGYVSGYGAGYYRYDSQLMVTLAVDGIWASGVSDRNAGTIVYVHDIGSRDIFLANQQLGSRTAYWLGTGRAYAFSFDHQPHSLLQYPGRRYPVRLCHQWRPDATWVRDVYGHGAYYSTSSVLWAAVHGATVSGYSNKTYFISIITCPPRRYYALTANSVPSYYRNETANHLCYTFATDNFTDPYIPLTGVTTRLNVSIDTLAMQSGVVLYGTGAYGVVSDVTLATFHFGLLQFNGIAPIYVTEVGTLARIYGTNNLGVQSQGQSNLQCFTLSLYQSETTAVTASLLYNIFVRPYSLTGTLVGATYYRYDTDVSLAAMHMGFVRVDEPAWVYVIELGSRTTFFSNDFRGLRSASSATAAQAFTLSLEPLTAVPESVIDPKVTTVIVSLARVERYVERTWGTHYYHAASDLGHIAVHMGHLRYEQNATLYCYILGTKRTVYLGSRQNGAHTFGYFDANTAAITLLPTRDHDVDGDERFSDALLTPRPILVDPLDLTGNKGGTSVWGAGVYSARSCVTQASLIHGIVDANESRVVYVHTFVQPAKATLLPAVCRRGFCSGYVIGVGGYLAYMFTLALNDTAPPAIAWAAQGVIEAPVQLIVGQSYTLYGTTIYRYDTHAQVAAFHAELIEIGERAVVYATIVPASAGYLFYSSYRRGITSGASNYAWDAYYISRSPEPVVPAVLVPSNFPMRIYADHTGGTLCGTTYYSWYSEIGLIALHMRLLPYNESMNVWVQRQAVTQYFYSSTSGDLRSSYCIDDVPILVSTTPALRAAPVFPLEIKLFVSRFPARSCSGAGTYHYQSDISLAAFHNNQLELFQEKTMYLHIFANRVVAGSYSRGVFCGGTNTPDEVFRLSNYQNPLPDLGTALQVANITVDVPVYGTYYGMDPFTTSVPMDIAGHFTNSLKPGTTVQVWANVFTQLAYPLPGRHATSGFRYQPTSSSYYRYRFWVEGQIPPSTSDAVTVSGVQCVNLTYPSVHVLMASTIWGSGTYTYDSDLTTAAAHAGILRPGDRSRRVCAASTTVSDMYIGSTAFGLTSNWYTSSAGFILSDSPTMPATGAARQ